MFLRSLTLKGFKSFAEPTTLELQPGITAVVGPNGSGKSNVVDAVAWVLGAQGPRSLRSTKMDDVIFAGAGRRPALGRAEVSLVIDNSSGLLPIAFSEVTVTRTLFRASGESEYALNGVACRLLDVQELLSDSGVGRQQHVIVSQGNLEAVLDARPEDRRLIVEEAAGILKYRRRKDKAQRRLESTQVNLDRLSDLLREVGRQIRPLQRQADAARRHGHLVAELRALRVFLAGRDLAALSSRADLATAEAKRQSAAEALVRGGLACLDAAVMGAEVAMTAVEHRRLTVVTGRLEALGERAGGMAAVLAERQRSIGRELAAGADSLSLVVSDDEIGRLAQESEQLRGAEAALATPRAEVEEAERVLALERAALSAPPEAANRAAEARGELVALRASIDRGRRELDRLTSRMADLDRRRHFLEADATVATRRVEEAGGRRAELAQSVAAAEAATQDASSAARTAEDALAEATLARQTLTARVDALTMALEGAGSADSAASLDARPGVLGSLASLVDVEPGWEAALEAVAGEALASVVVDGIEPARRLLVSLETPETAPTIVALGSGGRAGTQPPLPRGAGAPEGPRRLRDLVSSARAEVSRLLDSLLDGVVAVEGGWQAALELVLAEPAVVAVTRTGDRLSWSGWRLGGRGPEAARLALKSAVAGMQAAVAAVDSASRAVDEAQARRSAAAAHCSSLTGQATATTAETAASSAAVLRLEAEGRQLSAERQVVVAHENQLLARVEHETKRADELEQALPVLEAADDRAAAIGAGYRAQAAELAERTELARVRRTELEVRAAELAERGRALARRRLDVESRRARMAAAAAAAQDRRLVLELTADRTQSLSEHLDGRIRALDADLEDLRQRQAREADATRILADRLDNLREQRRRRERQLEEVRERRRRAELDAAETQIRVDAATESLRRDLDCEPEASLSAECPALELGYSAESRRRELDRELRLMGPVNPLAIEELAALEERHAFLTAQLDDVRSTRRDLAKVIRGVEAEMAELLAAAYADVADHYARLFETLFPGGQGRLQLTDPDHLLDSGIELEARPAGKNVRKLSLLSGGERSLVALAFLFAVFCSRPSPFYLLDEVEAALDDVNLHRFLALLDEFRQEAQLLVVTHQKRTMEAADCLYGVTMGPGGSSRVLSERAAVRT